MCTARHKKLACRGLGVRNHIQMLAVQVTMRTARPLAARLLLTSYCLLFQIKTALLTWVTRDCNNAQVPLPPFLRNKVAQTLVSVLQVSHAHSMSLGDKRGCLRGGSHAECKCHDLRSSGSLHQAGAWIEQAG